MSSYELEDYIATAAEKTPTNDENIAELRNAIQLIKKEYQDVLTQEEKITNVMVPTAVLTQEESTNKRENDSSSEIKSFILLS